jgi:hypothetical protein
MAITIIASPEQFARVYNPLVFGFTSTNYTKSGFRYVVDVFSASTSTKLGSFRVTPTIDGSGYIDLSRILSSSVSYDLTPTNTTDYNPVNSYVNYDIRVGEEYIETWSYTDFQYVSTPTNYIGYTKLVSTTPHTFVVGDQVDVTTVTSGVTRNINGLHKVIYKPSSTQIVIDVVWPGSGGVIGGTVDYADNRKTVYSGLTSLYGYAAFNAAVPFKDFPTYFRGDYNLGMYNSTHKFLTSIPTNFTVTPTQDLWVNIFNNKTDFFPYYVIFTNSNGDKFKKRTNALGTNYMRTLAVGPNNAGTLTLISGTTGLIKSDTSWYTIQTVDSGSVSATSKEYKIYIDNRCKIENYEVLFMDRMGSMMSYAFQLRAAENGTIVRDTYKNQIGGIVGAKWTYNTYDRDATPTNVEVTKTLTLNTNWMNDGMSVYFEELLSSPYTWVKIDGSYFACNVSESSFEVTRQKNKNLIRKTITVTLNNQNIINI